MHHLAWIPSSISSISSCFILRLAGVVLHWSHPSTGIDSFISFLHQQLFYTSSGMGSPSLVSSINSLSHLSRPSAVFLHIIFYRLCFILPSIQSCLFPITFSSSHLSLLSSNPSTFIQYSSQYPIHLSSANLSHIFQFSFSLARVFIFQSSCYIIQSFCTFQPLYCQLIALILPNPAVLSSNPFLLSSNTSAFFQAFLVGGSGGLSWYQLVELVRLRWVRVGDVDLMSVLGCEMVEVIRVGWVGTG